MYLQRWRGTDIPWILREDVSRLRTEWAMKQQFAAVAVVLLSVVVVTLLPVVGVPAVILTGIFWRGGPRWARVVMAVIAVLMLAYWAFSQPG
jgi:hypothetical protein